LDEHYFALNPGSHNYEFRIHFNDESLPALFNNSHGSLKYKIVAYIRHHKCYVPIGDKSIKFNESLNLLTIPAAPSLTQIASNESVVLTDSSEEALLAEKLHLVDVGNGVYKYLPGEGIEYCVYVYKKLTLTDLSVRKSCPIEDPKNRTENIIPNWN